MKKNNALQGGVEKSVVIFEESPVRRVWNAKDKKWYFVVADVVQVLTNSADPIGYIKDMRRRDSMLSKGWGQIATPLYIKTSGGRQKLNCAHVEGVLRIVQSIPSKKRSRSRAGSQKLVTNGFRRLPIQSRDCCAHEKTGRCGA